MAGIKNTKLKVALIGCGRIGAFTAYKPGEDVPRSYYPTNHAAAICATPGLELAAVCDTNLESAQKAATLHKVKGVYTDYKKMILQERPEIISIATRMNGRQEIISFAAKNGVKAIHFEKPLAHNLREAKRALTAIDKNNIGISYGAVRRYTPIYRQAKEILDSGDFGKLIQITLSFGHSQLLWAHPHTVNLMTYFVDKAEVDYVQSSFEFNKNDIKNNLIDMDPVLDFGFVKFKNGPSCIITAALGQQVRLICEKGEIFITGNGGVLQTINEKFKKKNIRVKRNTSGRCAAMSELRDFIKAGVPTSITSTELLNGQRILMALGHSGITGQKTQPTKIKENFTITGKFNGLYP